MRTIIFIKCEEKFIPSFYISAHKNKDSAINPSLNVILLVFDYSKAHYCE